MQLLLQADRIVGNSENLANDTTGDSIYDQTGKNASLKTIPTSGGSFDVPYPVGNNQADSNGNVDASMGSEEALLNRSSVLFVAVSFILLMVISLAWLVFYYVQRFRYLHSKERVSRRLAELARKAVARIPVKTLHPGDKETNSDLSQCAICIEPFRPQDNIRILPCRHYFHKVCIDPWLLEQRSCPMCKLDILQAYGLRSEFSTYPAHSDSGPGAGLADEATAAGLVASSNAGPIALSSGSEEDGLEHVSLLVHHNSSTGEIDLSEANIGTTATSAAAIEATAGDFYPDVQSGTASSDWWSAGAEPHRVTPASLPVPGHWPGLLNEEATVSLLDQHLASTGLRLASTALPASGHYCLPSAASTSVTFAEAAAMPATAVVIDKAPAKPGHSSVNLDRDEHAGQNLPDFYPIDGQKTEDVMVTAACSIPPATLSNKHSRQVRKHKQNSLANTISSLLVRHFQPPWSSSRPSPASTSKTKGLMVPSTPGSTSQPFPQSFLPPTPVSFHDLRVGPSSSSHTAIASSAALPSSTTDLQQTDQRPVGSECIVVAVVEPAPSNGHSSADLVQSDSDQLPHHSFNSCLAQTETATPESRSASPAAEDNQ